MKTLSLLRMKKSSLPNVWGKFLLGPYEAKDRIAALRLIMLLVASENEDMRRLGYRLALLYTKHTGDQSAIHAVASMGGLAPVRKISENLGDEEDASLVGIARDAFAESLKEGGIYLTAGQKQLKGEFLAKIDDAISVVAPTSYGKSSLMSGYLENTTGNFCVIVPTKSLLAQTRKMLLHQLPDHTLLHRKIITHHEMYEEGDENIIAVLTQERFLRLLQLDRTLCFEHLVIDESHNLFANEARARALASTLVLTLHRNPTARIKFLSPFIADSENLRSRINGFDIQHLGTHEYVKSELIHHVDFRAGKDDRKVPFVYDQFMDRSYKSETPICDNAYEYVLLHAGKKNIVYLNRPIKTHAVAKKISALLPDLENDVIDKACKDLGDYLNKDYLLISCIKKGVIFHHGSVPDNVRLYLEYLYATCADICFVITTSTLLEGVNLPADKMFLLNIKKGRRNLSASQLKNLIGRVSRFKEVFASGDVRGLLPEVHFVGSEHYPVSTNIPSFLKKNLREGKADEDKVENPMLEHAELSDSSIFDLLEELSFLENSEGEILPDTDLEIARPKTEIGKLCYLNRIADFDVLGIEEAMDQQVHILKRLGVLAKDSQQLIEMINEVFLRNITVEGDDEDSDIVRLRDNFKARDFYSMVLEWRTEGKPYQVMINFFIGYWKKIEDQPDRRIVYAGRWGTHNRDGEVSEGFNRYVDIGRLGHDERVTLAIARIEAEMAFLDFNVMKYIDCLGELGLIEPIFMDKLKYGSVNTRVKELVQAGMSHTLAQLMSQKDLRRYVLHFPSGAIGLSSEVIEVMEAMKINGVLINEAKYYTR